MQLDLLEWEKPGAGERTGFPEMSHPLPHSEFDETKSSTPRPSAQLRWNRANPEKIRAHAAVAAAIARGDLVKEGCFVEGCTAGPDETEFHHRFYDREHWLHGTFMCRKHHRRLHSIWQRCGVPEI